MTGTRVGHFGTLIVSVVLITSCGGGSSTVSAPGTAKQIAADKALAQQAVLRPEDMPAGYKATPHNGSSSDKIPSAVAQKFATCAKVPKSEIESFMNGDHKADQPSADSPDFNGLEASSLSQTSFANNVEIDRSSKDLSAPLELLGAESAQKCWKDLFQAAFDETAPAGGLVKDLAIIPLPTDSLGGDQAAAFEARVTLAGADRTVKAYLDFYLVRRGRAGITLLASGIGKRVPPVLEQQLVHKVVDRLKAAA
jgi:hypothetical protein